MEAFISRMIEDGPSANRPPHILLPVWALEPAPLLFSRFLTLAVLGCALLAGGCDRQSERGAQPQAEAAGGADAASAKPDRSHAGKSLPAMTLRDARGNTLDLASLKGKPLLVNLWATWCAPCVAELPTLNRLARVREGQLRVLTVSQDMADTGKVAPFLEQRGLDRLEPWLDDQSDLSFALGVNSLPTTILYDGDGHEVWRYLGDNDWTSEAAAALLETAESTQER
jgi:thiol-disulfide isomerase/thioredoxin